MTAYEPASERQGILRLPGIGSLPEIMISRRILFLLSCVFIYSLAVLSSSLLNPDDLMIADAKDWFEALSAYTARDGRNMMGFMLYGLRLTDIPYAVLQHLFMIAFAVSTTLLVFRSAEYVFRQKWIRFAPFLLVAVVLHPFTADLMQWICAYLIFAVGFAFVATAIGVHRVDGGVRRTAMVGLLTGLGTMAYQPVILVPLIVLVLGATRSILLGEQVSVKGLTWRLALVAVVSLAVYFAGGAAMSYLWGALFYPSGLGRPVSLGNILPNLPQHVLTFGGIILSQGPFRTIIGHPLALCYVTGFALAAFRLAMTRDTGRIVTGLLLLGGIALTVPNPMVALGSPDTYWPSPRTAFYLSIIFAFVVCIALEDTGLPRYTASSTLAAVALLLVLNVVAIYDGRATQTRIDAGIATEVGTVLAKSDDGRSRAVGFWADAARFQQWKSASHELGASMLWSGYANVPLLNHVNGTSYADFPANAADCAGRPSGLTTGDDPRGVLVCLR